MFKFLQEKLEDIPSRPRLFIIVILAILVLSVSTIRTSAEEKTSVYSNLLNTKLNNEEYSKEEIEALISDKNDLLKLGVYHQEEIVEEQIIKSNTVTKNDGLSLFSEPTVVQGNDGRIINTYLATYENGEMTKKELITSQLVTTPNDTVITYNTLQVGSTFSGRLTTYGGDCNGCYGGSSSGIVLSATTGVQGLNKGTLTYNGQEYYCLAADPSIPFGTIIKISNHNLSLPSTFYGIVVDRGGAIKGNKIDIFKGSEKGGVTYFSGGTTKNASYEIVSIGSGKNFWK